MCTKQINKISQRWDAYGYEYKDFLLDNIDHIKKAECLFKVINAKCAMNRSILFCESELRKTVLEKDLDAK